MLKKCSYSKITMTNETIRNSFRAVKADILKIEGELMNIKAQQVRILEQLEKFASKKATKKTAKKKTAKKKISKKK